ncbi:MAG: UDP-N-acetylmuramate dehydrogenase [bacterium]|nr:UDP-N-acetylmuramate dehydrogenase [bacterium]
MLGIPNLRKGEILAPYTTYKIGGPADYFAIATNSSELVNAVEEARREGVPYFVLGAGANILFGDKGFRGLVVKNDSKNFHFEGNNLVVESGAIIADLILEAAKRNLSGLEHFAGIPSTVGGALWQNLHFLSPDRQRTVFIEEILDSAKVLTEDGKLITVDKEFFQFGYDYSILHDKNFLVTEAVFSLSYKSEKDILTQVQKNLEWRNEKQPSFEKYPSCGSVFKKVEKVGAGRLIQQAGLKGYKIGGIQSSEQHANFLVNTGNGTAADVVALIKFIQKKVKEETGHQLVTEISFVGEF